MGLKLQRCVEIAQASKTSRWELSEVEALKSTFGKQADLE